jgi:hypothetical protein
MRYLAGLILLATTGPLLANPFSDFDDGTLQGWTYAADPGTGDIDNPGFGGNPDGYLRGRDDAPGGGGVPAQAEPAFSGDLSIYTSIEWDAYLFPNDAFPPTLMQSIVIGADHPTGFTSYIYTPDMIPVGEWTHVAAPIEESAWSITPWSLGDATFDEVISTAAWIRVTMDVSTDSTGNYESGLDNFGLIPEPASLIVLLAGVALIGRRNGG